MHVCQRFYNIFNDKLYSERPHTYKTIIIYFIFLIKIEKAIQNS